MASACSKFMHPPLFLSLPLSSFHCLYNNLPLTVYLGLSLPLSLIIPHAPRLSLTFNAYQGFISVRVLLQAEGFRWLSHCLAPAPLWWWRQSGQLWGMSYDKPTLLAFPWASPSIRTDNIWTPTKRHPPLPALSILPISFACSLLK